MSNQPLRRWLLVNYAGYPYAPNSLMPDNGLANLAGVARAGGGTARILDYSTVSTLERLTTPDLSRRLTRTWQAALAPGAGDAGPGFLRRLSMFAVLRQAESVRARLQARLLHELGDELAETVTRDGIEAVGFKLWNGDGWEGSAALAVAVRRRNPRVLILGGGPQVDMFTDRLLRAAPIFDALVYGEGEETLRLLAEAGADRAAWRGIPNLLFMEDGQVVRTEARMVADLDALPLPLYGPDVYPAMRGSEKIRIAIVDESRGCCNGCAFCIHPVKSNRDQRLKSVGKLLDEIAEVTRVLGTRTFRFAGSCTPYALLNAFAAETIRRQCDLAYASFAHVRDSAEADFATLRRSGCVSLFFGIESGSQPVLDLMNKKIRPADIESTVARARAAGIFTVGSLIYPAPGDNEQTRRETLALIDRVRPDGVTVQPPGVVPRTPWFDEPERYGIRFTNRDRYLERTLRWKVRLLMPPSFWSDLPVRIDGHRFKEALNASSRFSRQLGSMGLTTSVSDDLYLMSHRAGAAIAPFRDECRLAFLAGDAAAVRRLVERINAGV